MSQSRTVAAQRCAEGEGLDGDPHGRDTIKGTNRRGATITHSSPTVSAKEPKIEASPDQKIAHQFHQVSTYPDTGSVEQEHTLATFLLVNPAIRLCALFEAPAVGEDIIGRDIAIGYEAGALALADI